MPYEPEKDKILDGTHVEGTTLKVNLASYDGAETKVALVNEYKEGMFTTKIPRLSLEEAKELATTILKMIEKAQ